MYCLSCAVGYVPSVTCRRLCTVGCVPLVMCRRLCDDVTRRASERLRGGRPADVHLRHLRPTDAATDIGRQPPPASWHQADSTAADAAVPAGSPDMDGDTRDGSDDGRWNGSTSSAVAHPRRVVSLVSAATTRALATCKLFKVRIKSRAFCRGDYLERTLTKYAFSGCTLIVNNSVNKSCKISQNFKLFTMVGMMFARPRPW